MKFFSTPPKKGMPYSTATPVDPSKYRAQIEEMQELQPADPVKAKIYENENSIRHLKDGRFNLYPLSVNNKEIGKFGVGLQLYFSFMKTMIFCFSIMSIFAFVPLYSNLAGQGLMKSEKNFKLLETTLANQPRLFSVSPNKTNLNQSEINKYYQINEIEAKKFKKEMEGNFYMVALPDLFYTLVFLIFITILKKESKEESTEAEVENINASDFAIEVRGFPESMNQASDFAQHFSQFGQVVEAKLARNYHSTFFYHTELAKLLEKYILLRKKREIKPKLVSEKKLAKLSKQIQIVSEKTKEKVVGKSDEEEFKKHDYLPALKTFIIFESRYTRNKVLELYGKYEFKSFFDVLCCFLCRKKMPQNLKLKGIYEMKVSKPDPPSNILWENLDAKKGETCRKRFISLIITILLMLLTFAIIVAASILQTTNEITCPTGTLTQQDATTPTLLECYCKQQGFTNLYNNKQIRNFCWDQYVDYTLRFFLSICSALVIVIVNFLMKLILRKLGKYERYPTVTKEATSSTFKLFTAVFINTAIITLVINANIFGFIPSISLANPIPPLHSVQSESIANFKSDFTRKWFVDVGSKIMWTWIINMFSPHLAYLGMTFLLLKRLRRNKANKIFVSLFYGSGMPILIYMGTASLFLQYWLLRFYSRPSYYTEVLNEKVIKILPIAAIMHLMIGIYMYGSKDIFPKVIQTAYNGNASYSFIFSSGDSINDSNNKVIYNRASQTIYLFGFLLIVCVLYFFDITLFRILKMICSCRSRTQIDPATLDNNTYSQNLLKIKLHGIESYEIRSNPTYRDIVKAIDVNPNANSEMKAKN